MATFPSPGRKLIMYRVLPNNVVSDAYYLILNGHMGSREGTVMKEKPREQADFGSFLQVIVCIAGERCTVKRPLNASSALVIWDNGFDISMSGPLRAAARQVSWKAGYKSWSGDAADSVISHPITHSVLGEEKKNGTFSTLVYIWF